MRIIGSQLDNYTSLIQGLQQPVKIGKIIIVFIGGKIKIKELWEIYVKKGLTGRLREHVRLRGHIGGLDDSNINVARKDPQEHIGKALEEKKKRVERIIFTESD